MFDDHLDKILERHNEMAKQMEDSDFARSDAFIPTSREYASLEEIVTAIKTYKKIQGERDDLNTMLEDADTDTEMRALAQEELDTLKEALLQEETRIKIMLLPKDEADSRDVILEIRAGTGGEEAALFAADLCRMYQRYAEGCGWHFEIVEHRETGIGGIKEVIATISGKNVYSRMKFESGVHRVQRVPETESSGRIHTSAATVAVLPEAMELDIEINESDLRVDTYRSQGAGGQHVNTTDSAVRITHIPTNVVVTCQDEKSQHKNRARAMSILRARLYEAERRRVQDERAADRKKQVGSGDRSERIRTYNFPQGRISDHRINLTLYKLDQFLQGDLDDVIDSLLSADQAKSLADLQ